jgi:WD40 repeat protein
MVVSGASDNKTRIWDCATGQSLTPPLEHQGSLVYTDFGPDSEHILTVGRDDTARFWALPRAAESGYGKALLEEPMPARQAANPGGRQLMKLENDKAVQVTDSVTGAPVSPPLRHRSAIKHAILSPDGCFVLTASDDNTAQLWDAVSGARVNGPCQHKGTVLYAAFSSDGRYLITASEDHTARVWDAATGEPVTPPLKHSRALVRAHFSQDGNQAITVSADGAVRAWSLTPDNRPVTTLILLAQVLAGGRVDEKYGVLPLDSKSLRSAWQRLQADQSAAGGSSNP